MSPKELDALYERIDEIARDADDAIDLEPDDDDPDDDSDLED